MKKFFLIYAVAAVSLLAGCCVKSSTNRSYFAPDEKRCNVLPVKVGDSICANLLFDTGAPFGILTLDSTFCAKNSLLEDAGEEGKRVPFPLNSWAGHMPEFRRSRMRYNYSLSINIGESNVRFNKIFVQDTKRDFTVDVDGLVGFPENDTTHIWELNFGNNYLEVHQTCDFKMPADCYVLPLVKGPWNGYPYVKFPMRIKNSDGDSVTIDEVYLVDTGLLQDMVLMPNAKSFSFFERMEEVVFVTCAAGYHSRYVVSAEMFDNVKIDSLRVYTDRVAKDMIGAGYAGILGLNMLKRFNLFFDFKNMQLGFQPTGKKYERVIDPNVRRFYYSASFTEDQRYVVTMVADIKDNPFKEAGLLAGDEIITLDGVDVKERLSGGHKRSAHKKSGVRVLDILRNGERLQITCQTNDEGWVGE